MLSWNEVKRLADDGVPAPNRRVEKSDAEWREQLTPQQYDVARRSGTERPFSSEMCSKFEPGIYACICCGEKLFDADTKFESHSGWPSFTEPIADNVVAYHKDTSHGMVRIEAVCNTCDAHLGHVFPDGPPPTGLRYCMNAASLQRTE
ncbi:MAG: peptide-methionine (R)-S-oxide reductase MsrB [Alkalispirochaeta sp.]